MFQSMMHIFASFLHLIKIDLLKMYRVQAFLQSTLMIIIVPSLDYLSCHLQTRLPLDALSLSIMLLYNWWTSFFYNRN